jgi:CRISPR-associated protein Csm3
MEPNTIINGKLNKKFQIVGKITAKSGLHIGGTNLGLSIGGADATVVRNPITNQPYIPGSSLKGKMRSLLEKVEGKFGPPIGKDVKNGPLTNEPAHIIAKIFGTTPEAMKEKNIYAPTSRLIVRDCELTYDTVEKLLKSKNTDMPFTEVKTEVVIDRITSAATPRQLERVPAGAVFNMRMILNIFDNDTNDEHNLINKVLEGLALLQNDYLGGKGTRGSGEIEIKIEKIQYKKKDIYENDNQWKEYDKIIMPIEFSQMKQSSFKELAAQDENKSI